MSKYATGKESLEWIREYFKEKDFVENLDKSEYDIYKWENEVYIYTLEDFNQFCQVFSRNRKYTLTGYLGFTICVPASKEDFFSLLKILDI